MMKLLVLNLKTLATVLLLCLSNQLSANALFDNIPLGFPDIQSQRLNITYDAGSGDININSLSQFGNYAAFMGDNNVFVGDFSLDFSVDGSGALDDAGFFSIVNNSGFIFPANGSVFNTGAGAILLSGFVTDFYSDNSVFQVLLDITGGLFEQDYGLGAGITVSAFSGFLLGTNFVANDAGANTKAVQQVPEPSVLVLLTIAGLSFFRLGRQLQG